MEATLVSSILRIVGMKLAPLVIKEFNSIAGLTKDLQELQDLVEEINMWLQTAGGKSMRNGQSSNWLKKLKDAAYDAEDLVNEFYMEAEKHHITDAGIKNVVVKYMWTKPKSVVFECKTTHKIKAIKKRLDAIVKERHDYNTIANSMQADRPVLHINKSIGEVPLWTNVDEATIFGRGKMKKHIIYELKTSDDQQKVKIVSVTGLGGSGKTTLAKLVFNDANTIKKHFKVILWVHVSREFVVEKLVEKLFEAITGDKPDQLPLQHVSRTIADKLAGKRFLLVLDDVWTEDRIHWEQFMVHLRNGAPGSSILLTTRSRNVAEAVDSTYACELPFLSNKDSRKVFEQSFGMSMKCLDPEFVQVGTEIVNKCGGVPLAIKVLAGVLRGMKGIKEWQSIRDSNLLDVNDEERRVFSCLWLSYFHLPHHLKHCFTHCAIFPKGYVINRHHLISQWVVNGFVNTTSQVQQPEEVATGYFDSLLKVGFLQDPKLSSCGEVICKMHDLVHDLTRQILQDELMSKIATTDQLKSCRYVSLTSFAGKVDTKIFDKVRTLYIYRSDLALVKTTKNWSCIRTIILEHVTATSLPLLISKFENLRYLEISNVNCEALPEAISYCWNLQAIHIIDCRRLAILPKSIGNLKKLRTLELKGSRNIRSLPQSIGGCDNLQNLHLYGCGLEDIPNSVANIEKLRVLTILRNNGLRQLPPLESFGKLFNLQTMALNNCWDIQHLPQWITLLSNLECLDLEYCEDLVDLPESIGNLKMLKVLNLKGCHKLCGLPIGCGQLTRLQKLGCFAVGDSTRHARISELGNLDKLNGELRVENIEYVKDPYDAEKAYLKRKDGIWNLSLVWHSRKKVWASDKKEFFSELSSVMEKDLDLLNNLEPPPEIMELKISGYRGLQLPRWMIKKSDSCDLDDTHILKESNPPQFPYLTKLVLENLPNLEHLQGLVNLPGIEVLELRVMPKLVELLTTTGLANGDEKAKMQYCFPRLSTLVISDCLKLIVKYFPPSLKRLILEGRNEQLMSPGSFFSPGHAYGSESSSSSCTVDMELPHLTQPKHGRFVGSSGWEVSQNLTVLYIYMCKDLRQLPDSMRSLTGLRTLTISNCNNLCVLPEWLGELQYLKNLSIRLLPAVSILPQSIQHLTSLRYLTIMQCYALQQLPEQLGDLCSLSKLGIHLSAVTHLPECIQLLTSLRFLNLFDCDALTQLPESLGELSALQSLDIWSCPGLTCLPHSIRRLTGLKKLTIINCPELVRRCKEGVGEDWHLVSHIPDLMLEVPYRTRGSSL